MAELLFVFKSLNDATLAEKAMMGSGLEAQLVPVPDSLQAQGTRGDLGVRVPPPLRKQAVRAMAGRRVVPADMYIMEGEVFLPMDSEDSHAFSGAVELLPHDVVSIIGCGGKTMLTHRLAQENRNLRVLLSTTTKIRPPDDLLIDRVLPLQSDVPEGVNLLAGAAEDGKLTSPPPDRLQSALASADLSLIESDGSRCLPLKGWRDTEPVIIEQTTLTLGVCVLWPVGEPLTEEIVHRPAEFFALTGAREGEPCTLAHIAAMVSHPHGMFQKAAGRRILYINHLDEGDATQQATGLVSLLPPSFRQTLSGILYGSLRNGFCRRLEY